MNDRRGPLLAITALIARKHMRNTEPVLKQTLLHKPKSGLPIQFTAQNMILMFVHIIPAICVIALNDKDGIKKIET